MHPGQFAQLGSPRQEVVAQTFVDLENHAKVFQFMGFSPEQGSVMIVHGGGAYGNKTEALTRWEKSFRSLSPQVSQYIVLENDEWQYGVMDLLPLCEKLQIPLCIDFFHHEVSGNKTDIYNKDIINRVMAIWKARGIQPKFHYSNQAPNARKGTHGDCVQHLPPALLNLCLEHGVDLMIEAKSKDNCVMELYEKYFRRTTTSDNRVEWHLR